MCHPVDLKRTVVTDRTWGMALIDVPEVYGLLRSVAFRTALRGRLFTTRSSLVGERSGRTRPAPAPPSA